MKKIILTLSLITFLGLSNAAAQVGIGTNTPNASAVLELQSTDKGFLPPRMTIAQRDGIVTPVEGLTIYNTDNNCLEFFDGTDWRSACDGQVVTTPPQPQLGSTFTAYDNGNGEFFSQNTTCQNKTISAQHNSTTCSGNVVVGSNTYPLVLINGQCWMKTNIKEAPTAPCADPINTGCNSWINTSSNDIGSWGYYNTSNTSGSSGWRTTEVVAGEGALYQWSAAMNGSNSERAQGVCPTGWHIPSDCEWMYLEHGQGLPISQHTSLSAGRGGNIVSPKLLTLGDSGFDALFSGYRSGTDGSFVFRGNRALWWSSSEVSSNTTLVTNREIVASSNGVGRENINKAFALSVRCIKD
jgi:uncharacterized protein (TIGR02145 family)